MVDWIYPTSELWLGVWSHQRERERGPVKILIVATLDTLCDETYPPRSLRLPSNKNKFPVKLYIPLQLLPLSSLISLA